MHGVVLCEVSLDGTRYLARLDQAQRLHLPLIFDGPAGEGVQPNHFGAPRARAWPLQIDGFTGDTHQGGSCNAFTCELTPHCNGTHTETSEHLTGERRGIDALLKDVLQPAALISVAPVGPSDTSERARHPFLAEDRLITAAALADALDAPPTPAVIVRTLPNGDGKRARRYEGTSPAPYFTLEAAQYLVDRGVCHLLVDTPSLDRAHDEGYLGAHRVFWGLSADDDTPTGATDRVHCTVTEMVYVDDATRDGLYLLNLQVAPFQADAAPARVIVFPLEATT